VRVQLTEVAFVEQEALLLEHLLLLFEENVGFVLFRVHKIVIY